MNKYSLSPCGIIRRRIVGYSSIAAYARGRIGRGILLLVLLAAGFAAPSWSQAPLAVAVPASTRSKLVAAARSYEGSPYRYGGVDRDGFDCSGLVYRVCIQVLAISPPRTARELAAFCEPIERAELQPGDLVFFDTTGKLAHVGIYAGEGLFIHSASDGPRTGVVETSLSERYWAAAYAGGGRLVTPAGYLGIILAASAGPGFGTDVVARGGWASLCAVYPVLGFELGLEIRPEYDATLGVFRLPATLSVGVDKRLRFFAGPALTFGRPALGARAYEAGGGIAATAGLAWTPFSIRVGSFGLGLTGELAYNRYIAADGQGVDTGADLAACLRVGCGLRLRWGI
jgi:probable lipoprotein NlpC